MAARVDAVKPFVVWAAHFGFCYAAVAVACLRGLGGVRGVLLAASALAAIVLAVMAWRAYAGLRRAPHSTRWALRFGAALLALLAVGWTALPVPLLPACDAPPALSLSADRRGSPGGRRRRWR